MAKLYRPDGSSITVAPNNGKSFTLDELYTLIECSVVERFFLPDGRQVWIDEEAKFKAGLQANDLATKLLVLSGGIPDDYVLGTALVMDSVEAGDGKEET